MLLLWITSQQIVTFSKMLDDLLNATYNHLGLKHQFEWLTSYTVILSSNVSPWTLCAVSEKVNRRWLWTVYFLRMYFVSKNGSNKVYVSSFISMNLLILINDPLLRSTSTSCSNTVTLESRKAKFSWFAGISKVIRQLLMNPLALSKRINN